MTTVLISGAGIAGPALAHRLIRHGFDVTVVEKSPTLRTGGQAVDFKGKTHLAVLRHMGILDDVRRHQTGKTDLVIVTEHDRPVATIPGEFTGGDLEILRGDLGRILYEKTAPHCEYLFGDTITALVDQPDGVDVTFDHSPPRRVDLVVGADGIHSTVRRLAFGPNERFVRFLGHYYALIGTTARTPDPSTRNTATMHNSPGRMLSIDPRDNSAFAVFASDEPGIERADTTTRKQFVRDAFNGMSWPGRARLDSLESEPDFHLDSISRVEMDTYTHGRVALLGDAAYGNTLGGFGTGLALVGAYVLAGELASANNLGAALARYDEQMRGYAKVALKANAGPFLAPPNRFRIRMRDWTFKYPLPLRLMMKVTDHYATNIDLAAYPSPAQSS